MVVGFLGWWDGVGDIFVWLREREWLEMIC